MDQPKIPKEKRKAAPSTTLHPMENEQLADVKTEHAPLLVVHQGARCQGMDTQANHSKKTVEQKDYPEGSHSHLLQDNVNETMEIS